MRRGVKIGIIIGVICLIFVGIGVSIYYNFTDKSTYHITTVEKTDFTVADFVDKSELRFFKNDTFHITIEHKEKGLSLTGIGTYTIDNKTYHLTFIQAYARDNEGNIVDYTTECNQAATGITCTRSGNRIKFTDHKGQTFYFG